MTACVAVGPDYHKPAIAIPAAWNGAADRSPARLGGWWRGLRDPLLDRLVADGVSGGVDAAVAMARLRQARADFAAAGGALSPTLDAAGKYMRMSGPDVAQLGLRPKWEIDLFGGARRGAEASYYGLQSAREQLCAALVVLAADIADNYVRLRGAQTRIAIARRNAASQRRTVALTETRLSAGAASALDLMNAETQAAATEAQIPALRIDYAGFLDRLALLTGRPAAELAPLLDKPRAVPAVPPRVAAGLPAALLQNRPDIRAAERDYAAATARIGQKQAALYPAVSLTGTIDASGQGGLARLSTVAWSFGPSVAIPIFQGGRLNAAVDAARAARDEKFADYRKAVLTALSEVENAAGALRQNRLRLAQLSRIEIRRRAIAALTLEQYAAGARGFSDVLTAQRNLLAAQTDLVQVRTDVASNYVALQKALGGGWDGPLDLHAGQVADGYDGPRLVRPGPLSGARP